MLVELVAVFLFVSVIITVATDDSAPWKGVLAPVAIGGFIFVAAVTIGPTSGGSFNPARSIDPAIWALEFGNLWIYIVGPLIGAAIAGGLSIALRDERAGIDGAAPGRSARQDMRFSEGGGLMPAPFDVRVPKLSPPATRR